MDACLFTTGKGTSNSGEGSVRSLGGGDLMKIKRFLCCARTVCLADFWRINLTHKLLLCYTLAAGGEGEGGANGATSQPGIVASTLPIAPTSTYFIFKHRKEGTTYNEKGIFNN